MIDIELHWPDPQSQTIGPKTVRVHALPQRGDLFELERGDFYEVDRVVFSPYVSSPDGVCPVWVMLKETE